MSAQDTEETQSAYGEGGGGPGAPTPLSALDVMLVPALYWWVLLIYSTGLEWDNSSRY